MLQFAAKLRHNSAHYSGNIAVRRALVFITNIIAYPESRLNE